MAEARNGLYLAWPALSPTHPGYDITLVYIPS